MSEFKENVREATVVDEELKDLSHMVLDQFRQIPGQYLEGPELNSMLDSLDKGIEALRELSRLTEAVKIEGDPRLAAVLYARLITNSQMPAYNEVTGPYIMASFMPGLFSLVNNELERIKEFSMELFNVFYYMRPQKERNLEQSALNTEKESAKGSITRLFTKIGRAFQKKDDEPVVSDIDRETTEFVESQFGGQAKSEKSEKNENKRTEPAEILAMILTDNYPPETAAFMPDSNGVLQRDAEEVCGEFEKRIGKLTRCLRGLRNGIIEDCQKRRVQI